MEDALAEAADCLGSVPAFRMSDRAGIPPPGRAKKAMRMIPVPLWIGLKSALYSAMREHGVNNSELARRLGAGETVVRRMLDPNHDTKVEKLQAALEALGKRILVTVEDAAWQEGSGVALKVLPAAFAQDADRMARFKRETLVLASLNHPNIAAIYGIEERAIVMELVEGENLRGPLPVDKALNYARQIIEALEAAHDKKSASHIAI